jgi:hypothetical protein
VSAVQEEAQAALRATSTDALLDTFAALTHRMHQAQTGRENEHTLRAQRDLIRAEILRRTGDAG